MKARADFGLLISVMDDHIYNFDQVTNQKICHLVFFDGQPNTWTWRIAKAPRTHQSEYWALTFDLLSGLWAAAAAQPGPGVPAGIQGEGAGPALLQAAQGEVRLRPAFCSATIPQCLSKSTLFAAPNETVD